MKQYYSNGKLLLTAEYLVLDGAKALALPTKFGQDLIVEKTDIPELVWNSFDVNKKIWFTSEFDIQNLDLITPDKNIPTSKTLQRILKEALKLASQNSRNNFLSIKNGLRVTTSLSFPQNWGLGTSSTLINNIANWAQINAYDLLKNSFGGSGYDIACAENNSPILFQLNNENPIVEQINFNPPFKDQLYFVHLNKKQNSREGIKKYRDYKGNISALADEISKLTDALLKVSDMSLFEKTLIEHENIIASVINEKPVQKAFFSDYFGQTKSLGAWGGDFILASGNEKTPAYFKNRGFQTVIPYADMIL